MTIQEMHNFFDDLQDKYASAYFSDDEKDRFLNRAQIEAIEELLPDHDSPGINLEQSSIIFEKLDELVYETSDLNTSSGVLTKADINSDIQSQASDSEEYYMILNVSFDGIPCNYVRHNDWYRLKQNYFKVGSPESPKYKTLSTKLEFLPLDDTADVKVTVLKTPVEMDLSTPVHSELPESMHNRIVAIGLEFAGIASRDEALMAIENISK